MNVTCHPDGRWMPEFGRPPDMPGWWWSSHPDTLPDRTGEPDFGGATLVRHHRNVAARNPGDPAGRPERVYFDRAGLNPIPGA